MTSLEAISIHTTQIIIFKYHCPQQRLGLLGKIATSKSGAGNIQEEPRNLIILEILNVIKSISYDKHN